MLVAFSFASVFFDQVALSAAEHNEIVASLLHAMSGIVGSLSLFAGVGHAQCM